MTAKVLSAAGLCEVLAAGEGSDWQPLKAGQELGELSIIRTGLRSKVVLQFQDRGALVIRSSTQVGIREFRHDGTKVQTRLGLKYGNLRATIDSSRGPIDWRIATPVAVLSVRGTAGEIGYTADRGLCLRGTAGTWHFETPEGDRNVQAGESTDDQLTPSDELAKKQREQQMADAFGGLTQKEKKHLLRHGDGRGLHQFFGGMIPAAQSSSSSNRTQLQKPNDFNGFLYDSAP